MPNLRLTNEELLQIVDACHDYAFLGSKFEDDWTDEDEERLAAAIKHKLKEACDKANLDVAQHYATHWRDDDNPNAEYMTASSPVSICDREC